jgi:hypothetical protein
VKSIASFVTEVIRQSPIAVAEAIRTGTSCKHASPKNCPFCAVPSEVSKPCSDFCGNPHATVLNEENKIGVFALIVDFLIVFVVGGASTSADLYEQAMSVNMVGPKLRFHGISPFETGAQHYQ